MNGRERILARIAGQPVDHWPLMPITMMYAGDLAGIHYREYATDGRKLAEAQIRTAETFGFDYVSAISDPAREAADLGATIQWFDDQPPAIVEEHALLADKATLSTLRFPDGPRVNDRILAVSELKRRAGDGLLIEGWVEGPCAMSADLRGLNTLMLDLYDDPAFIEALFEFVVGMEIDFARRQIEAGADIIGIGDAAASLIGPKAYKEHVQPWETKLIAAIRGMGAKTRLHICGNTRRIVKGMGETGADIVDLDFLTPMSEARAAMGPAQVLLGNIDPVRILRDGTPEDVVATLTECRDACAPNYIVGAGCEIPRGTPRANVEAMTRVARS